MTLTKTLSITNEQFDRLNQTADQNSPIALIVKEHRQKQFEKASQNTLDPWILRIIRDLDEK